MRTRTQQQILNSTRGYFTAELRLNTVVYTYGNCPIMHGASQVVLLYYRASRQQQNCPAVRTAESVEYLGHPWYIVVLLRVQCTSTVVYSYLTKTWAGHRCRHVYLALLSQVEHNTFTYSSTCYCRTYVVALTPCCVENLVDYRHALTTVAPP